MTDQKEYVLGTDDLELARLREQHEVWLEQSRALWERAGFRGLGTLADLGCGPGYTSLALADFAGRATRVLAIDESERFIAALRAHLVGAPERRVEPRRARVEQLGLPRESLDGAYARWLFSWLEEPAAGLAQVARALRPGARVALHEYLHWGSFSLLPPRPDFDLAIRACLASWSGMTIDVAAHAADHAARAGLELEHFEPIARVGPPGSPVWRWLEDFHRSYLPRLAERGLIGRSEVETVLRAWERHAELPGALVLAPTMAAVVLRKP